MESLQFNQIAKKTFESKLQLKPTQLNEVISAGVDHETGECPENFKCNICHQLITEPQECSSCNQLFCKICI